MSLREVLVEYGVDVKGSEKVAELDEHISAGIEKLQQFGAALLEITAVAKLIEFAEQAAHMGAEIQDTSERLGIATDSLQELTFAAGQSGVSTETFSNALGRLSDAIGDAALDKSGPAAKNFKKLGISITDSAGMTRDAGDVMADFADKIQKTQSPAERVSMAMGLFGKAGKNLIPVLADGSEGMAEMRKQAKELGGGFSKDALEAAHKYDDTLARVNFAQTGLIGTISKKMLPAFDWVADHIAKAIAWFNKLIDNTHLVQVALGLFGVAAVALGGVITYSFAGFIFPILGILAAFALLALEIDDLITMFEGGDSAMGRFIDTMFGAGATKQVVEALTEAWEYLKVFLLFLWDIIKMIFKGWIEILSDLPQIIGAVGTAFQVLWGIIKAVWNIAKFLVELFFTDPSQWPDKLAEGLKGAFKWITDVYDKATKAVEKIKELLGLNHSTSQGTPDGGAKAAALSGGLVRQKGQSWEDAIAVRDKARADAGLPPISTPIPGVMGAGAQSGAGAMSGPSTANAVGMPASSSGGAALSQTVSTQITVQGNADAKTVDQIKAVVNEQINNNNRQALDSLAQMSGG